MSTLFFYLRRVQKRCKQHNDEDIVARCAGQDHLRDALVRSATAFHQLHHARHDDRGRHRREHRAHDRRLHARDAKEARREQHIADDLARGGQARHQDRRAADFFKVAQIERQPRLEQNDDECELAHIRRDRQDRAVQHVEHARPQQDARRQHADDARQLQLLAERGQRKADQEDERE